MPLPERPILTGQEKAKLILARKKLDNRSLDEQIADQPKKGVIASDPFDHAISNYLLTGEPDDPGKRLDLLATDEGRIQLMYYPLLDAVMEQEDIQTNVKRKKSGKRESDRFSVSYGLKYTVEGEHIEISFTPSEGKLFVTAVKKDEDEKYGAEDKDTFELTRRELTWISLSSTPPDENAETPVRRDPALAREEGVFRLKDLGNMFLRVVGGTGR